MTTQVAEERASGDRQPDRAAGAGAAMLRSGVSRLALVGVWIVMIGLYSILIPHLFLTSSTFTSIFNSQQILVFLTASLLCTIIVGEFVDLSVPSVLCLSATIVPVLVAQHGWNIWLGCFAAVGVALLVGAIQGGLVVYLGVNTIVVTLGMSTFLLGIALWISNLNYATGLSTGFSEVDLANVFGLPISFYYGVAMMVVFAYILAFTPLGRHMRFVGANREVSRLAGIRVNRIRFGAFVMAAFIAGLGGVIAAGGPRWIQPDRRANLPAADVRRDLPGDRGGAAGQVQPARDLGRHLFPGHGNPWARTVRRRQLGV